MECRGTEVNLCTCDLCTQWRLQRSHANQLAQPQDDGVGCGIALGLGFIVLCLVLGGVAFLVERQTRTGSPVVTKFRPVATPILTPTPTKSKQDLHRDGRLYMLELINAQRTRAGLNPVTLGDNAAAQRHADAALVGCFSSHWDLDGLKPYMRYSLAGGYQSNAENVTGLNYCIRSGRFAPLSPLRQEVREIMTGLMDSPGHRANILRPWHRRVNIGLARTRFNIRAVQHFEGDYVQLDQLPTLDDGILLVAGFGRNGFHLHDQANIQVFYDPAAS